MNQYTPDNLRDVLNYDTNQEQQFDLVDRNQIHRAISRKMDGSDHDLPLKLHKKISEVLIKIKTTKYQAKEIFYYLDSETMLIKSSTKNYE